MRTGLGALLWFCSILPAMAGQVLRVGPEEKIRTVAEAARKARDGDIVEIVARDYRADVAVWTQDGITVRGVGGRARLIADGASAEQKAIWVVRGGAMTVENIEFNGARVPHQNGAGIRFEKGHLVVRNCVFVDNEMSLLTSNDKDSELEIEDSEFGQAAPVERWSHNLYVGSIRKLTVRGSYFHHGWRGHLLKSRATENHIIGNRLIDGEGGRASYELEFPNGGIAHVSGNTIRQSATTENPVMVSFGAEGYTWPRNELHLIGNTLIDDRKPPGTFLRVWPGADQVETSGNRLVGDRSLFGATQGHE